MFPDPSLLGLTSAMARHAGHVHQVTAGNVARADVPGARATEAARFSDVLRGDAAPRQTRERVSLDREMVQMARNAGRHDAAVTVWSRALDMVRLAGSSPR